MACDLKIEIFAFKLFHKFWHDMEEIETVPDIREVYADEFSVDNTYLEACDDLFIKASNCRSNFLSPKYMSSISNEERNFKTLSELYDFVIRMCDRDDLFGHLTVFERMLATSDFVVNICYIHKNNFDSPIDVLMYGHTLWSMYFDKFTKEFNEKGGWSQLKREVKCYELLSEFDTIFQRCSVFYLQAIKEAIVNFCHFKNAISYQEQKHPHPVRISVLWIHFRIENFESYINIPLSYETSINSYEADLLLDDLKVILDPTRCNPDNLEISKEKHQSSTEMSYSEMHSTLGERKVNQDDEIQYSGFEHEIGCIEKVSDEFSRISTIFKESQITCQASATEELAFDSIVPKENLGSIENTFTVMKQTSRFDDKYSHKEQNFIVGMQKPSETSIKYLSNIPDLDYECRSKSHMNKTEDSTVAYFYEGNEEECDETINTDEVISILQGEETKYQRISSPKNVANSTDVGSINKIINSVNKIENSKEVVKMSSCSKNERTEIFKSMNNSSSSKINEHERNEKITTKDLPFPKDFSSIKENTNADDEICRIRIARKELRKEQRDHEIKNFLKMLLVLGDMEGTEFVLSTLQTIEEDPKNTQESSNNQKKNPKTKGKEFELSPLNDNKEYPEKSLGSLNKQKKRSKKKKPKK